MDEADNTGKVQPNRRKLKKLYNKIKNQMEFYFSDSNLVRDKFLSDLISKDPDGFVDIEIFKKFNKIRALTNSCDVIASSVAKSSLFEVSKDGKKVRRTSPVEFSKDFDACTLYVEKLPKYADQKWVRDVFEQYGTVKYVNVPRYKSSNNIKGFAFVEFERPEDVQNACEKVKRKRKREDSDSEVTTKRFKESDNEDPIISVIEPNDKFNMTEAYVKDEKDDGSSDHPKEKITADGKDTTEVPNNHVNETKLEENKSKKKRSKAKKHHSNTEKPTLRIMRKSEWKTYRNKYLELQRTTMSYLKKQIMLETQELKEQEGNVKSMDVSEPKKSLQFLPGVIIKVKMTEPVKNSTEIKNQVKANAVVAYIDAPVECKEIFIRCHNSEDAQSIIKEEKFNHLGITELLQGDEEKKYWEKIEADRKNKYSNPVPHKKRGREKLLAKAAKLEEMKNKHIYFDE